LFSLPEPFAPMMTIDRRQIRQIRRTEHAQGVVREDLAHRLFVETGVEERGAQTRKSAGIGKLCRRVNVPLEVRANGHVVQPRHLRQVLNLGDDVAEHGTPPARQERSVKVHADHAASLGNAAQLFVAQIPRVVGERARVRVRRNDDSVRLLCEREHVGDCAIGRVGDIDDQIQSERAPYENPAALGQSELLGLEVARRACQLVRIRMHQADDAQPARRPLDQRVRIGSERP